ncbi:MAG TPA: helix-turn-helix transcriptional regulator [Stellaceae bacterium]|nr:helix-turn-helix transcriptional regulator [Stellaceae bacterium]
MTAALDALRVVDRLYAAALDTATWPSALDALTQVMRAGHTILVAESDGAAPMVAADRVDDGALAQLICAGGAGLLGPLNFGRLPLSTVVKRSSIVADDQFLRSHYYNDIIRPLNGFNSAFFRKPRAPIGFTLAVCRGREDADFAEQELAVLRTVLPHLTNAVELTYRLAAAPATTPSLAHLMDQLEDGVIVADAAACPRYLNKRAERILAERDGLTVERSGLAAAAGTETRRLRQAITALAVAKNGMVGNGDGAGQRHRLFLERPSLRPPLMLTLVPIARLGMAAMGGAPGVAIFLKELAAPVRVDKTALTDAFRLTRREAEIAAMIGEGCELEQIAAALDLSIGTVRSHLKRVFSKTDTHRQSALASLVRGLAES